jgi:DNA-binding NarL/FixJ family response regulator
MPRRRRDHATARVAVIDPLPLFREGVTMVLSAAGYQAETPADLVGWAGRHPSSVVVLTLTGESEWRLLARLHAVHVTVPLLALIDTVSTEQGVRAVQAGARSVAPRGIAAEALQRTVAATADGQAVLPADVATRLAAAVAPANSRVTAPDRIRWLRQLASGVTVAQLADQVGYSERAMFRLLSALYKDIGARNRVEALMLARDKGWI